MTFLPAAVSGGEEYAGCLQCDCCGLIWPESATRLLDPCVVACPDCFEEKSEQSEELAELVTRRVTQVNNNPGIGFRVVATEVAGPPPNCELPLGGQ